MYQEKKRIHQKCVDALIQKLEKYIKKNKEKQIIEVSKNGININNVRTNRKTTIKI